MTSNYQPIVRTRRADFALRYLNLQEATQIEDAVWEDFQINELNNDSMFAIERKCRQVGWSFLIALRGTLDAILDARSSVYNSINQFEAQDKIKYARAAYYNLESPYRLPKIITDNKNEIEFDNGARLVSTANARGKPNSNFFGDEFAWKQNAREIYTAAVPVISKGGTFRIGSSTNGASGLFWEIDTESIQSYPGFVRTSTKWWEVEAFCVDVAKARREAPQMLTKERVEQFATPRLKTIFANMVIEDFSQEYQAEYVDETTAWITWAEIQANTVEDLKCTISEDTKTIDNALLAVSAFAGMIQRGEVESVFAGGVDIGRTKDATEIFLVGKSTVDTYPLRLMLTLNKCDYDSQIAVLEKVLSLPVTKMLIDKTGLGNQLAETMEKKYFSKVEGVNFTNPSKELWATDIKKIFQQHKTAIPNDKDLAYQIHSIKKRVTASNNLVFDTERNEKHHADKFWALALALQAANQPSNEWTMTRRPTR